MIDTTKILKNLKTLLEIEDDSSDKVLEVFIETTVDKLLELRYPFDMNKTQEDLEPRWESWIARAARSIYESQGQYNVSQFSQNGVQITYKGLQDGIDEALVRAVMPYAGVPKK